MKKRILICDKEPAYAGSLMEIVNGHTSLPFEMRAFSNEESLEKYLQEEEAEVLLISPACYSHRIHEHKIPHVFLLSEGQKVPSEWSLPHINKYQRADRIMQTLMEKIEPQAVPGTAEEPRMIGVYSPLHRVGKTTFALALCQEIGRERRALYLNLEDMSGFEGIFAQEYESDLTDLLYYARQNREKFPTSLSVITRKVQDIEFIPPARIPMELKAVRLDEWKEFLTLLRESGIYDVVVLDLGDGLQGLTEILSLLDRIYMPVAADPVSQSKLRQYEDMLEILDYNEVLEHTKKLSLPVSGILKDGGGYTHELLWGPMSGYARELLEGDTL